MADKKLIEQLSDFYCARALGELPDYPASIRLALRLKQASEDLFANPALIKRMAEGVGFEVKEKPLPYAVMEDVGKVYVLDLRRELGCREHTISRKDPDPELARHLCQEIADELNQKERAADGK